MGAGASPRLWASSRDPGRGRSRAPEAARVVVDLCFIQPPYATAGMEVTYLGDPDPK